MIENLKTFQVTSFVTFRRVKIRGKMKGGGKKDATLTAFVVAIVLSLKRKIYYSKLWWIKMSSNNEDVVFLTNEDGIEEAKQVIRGCLSHQLGNIRDPNRSVRYNYIRENDSLTVLIAIEKPDVDERVHEITLKPSTSWKQVFDFCNEVFLYWQRFAPTAADIYEEENDDDDDWTWPIYFL